MIGRVYSRRRLFLYKNTNKKNKTISQIIPTISINHSRDLVLMNIIKDYLNCGVVETINTRNSVSFVVYKFLNIYDDIIPLFEHPLLLGTKALDFKGFCKVCLLVKKTT